MSTFNKLFYLVVIWMFLSCENDSQICENVSNASRVDEKGCPVFIYLDDVNGTTIKATPEAEIGESYQLNGISYLLVDSAMLYTLAAESGDLSKVVTSRITNLQGLLEHLPAYPDSEFHQDISHWDVSHVTDMSYVLSHAGQFNADISNWDVSQVTNMERMFMFAERFNQDISNWDVSRVTNMFHMFQGAWSFDQNLSTWTIEQVIKCAFFDEGTLLWRAPKPIFRNCPTGDLIGNYAYRTSKIWCNGGQSNGTVDIVIQQDDGQYTFSDWSFGSYSYCYGGASTFSGPSFTVMDGVFSIVDPTDGFGSIWSIDESTIDGEEWSFKWSNDYGESASVVMTFPGGVPFTLE